jgi:hypothetical protein
VDGLKAKSSRASSVWRELSSKSRQFSGVAVSQLPRAAADASPARHHLPDDSIAVAEQMHHPLQDILLKYSMYMLQHLKFLEEQLQELVHLKNLVLQEILIFQVVR